MHVMLVCEHVSAREALVLVIICVRSGNVTSRIILLNITHCLFLMSFALVHKDIKR